MIYHIYIFKMMHRVVLDSIDITFYASTKCVNKIMSMVLALAWLLVVKVLHKTLLMGANDNLWPSG